MQCPLLGEFGEEHIFSIYEAKETSLLKSEKASLQQQLNQFQHEVLGGGGGGGVLGALEVPRMGVEPPALSCSWRRARSARSSWMR